MRRARASCSTLSSRGTVALWRRGMSAKTSSGTLNRAAQPRASSRSQQSSAAVSVAASRSRGASRCTWRANWSSTCGRWAEAVSWRATRMDCLLRRRGTRSSRAGRSEVPRASLRGVRATISIAKVKGVASQFERAPDRPALGSKRTIRLALASFTRRVKSLCRSQSIIQLQRSRHAPDSAAKSRSPNCWRTCSSATACRRSHARGRLSVGCHKRCVRSGGHPLAACLLRWQTNGAARADQASLCRAARSWAPYASALRARDVCTGAPAPQRRYSGTTWPCSSAPRRLRTRTATLAPPPPRASPSARPASAPGEWRTKHGAV